MTQVHRSLTRWFTRSVHSDECPPVAPEGRSLVHRGRGAAARFLLQSRRTREPQPRPSALFMPFSARRGGREPRIVHSVHRIHKHWHSRAASRILAPRRSSPQHPLPPEEESERTTGPAAPPVGPVVVSAQKPSRFTRARHRELASVRAPGRLRADRRAHSRARRQAVRLAETGPRLWGPDTARNLERGSEAPRVPTRRDE
jgi:type IV secretory pathway VirB10-like protein